MDRIYQMQELQNQLQAAIAAGDNEKVKEIHPRVMKLLSQSNLDHGPDTRAPPPARADVTVRRASLTAPWGLHLTPDLYLSRLDPQCLAYKQPEMQRWVARTLTHVNGVEVRVVSDIQKQFKDRDSAALRFASAPSGNRQRSRSRSRSRSRRRRRSSSSSRGRGRGRPRR